jgi:hypothetical protein
LGCCETAGEPPPVPGGGSGRVGRLGRGVPGDDAASVACGCTAGGAIPPGVAIRGGGGVLRCCEGNDAEAALARPDGGVTTSTRRGDRSGEATSSTDGFLQQLRARFTRFSADNMGGGLADDTVSVTTRCGYLLPRGGEFQGQDKSHGAVRAVPKSAGTGYGTPERRG